MSQGTNERPADKTESLQAHLQTGREGFQMHLDEVTCVQRLPPVRQINALLHVCQELQQSLRPFAQSQRGTTLAQMILLMNLPDQLTKMEVEAVLLRETRMSTERPTRALLNQQCSLKRQGHEVLCQIVNCVSPS